jgi:SAM-dependent methyltransferase
MTLISDRELSGSEVVANATMNRERGLQGVNSYARELGFHPLRFLLDRPDREPAVWLDLCCGSGRALIEAGECLGERGTPQRASLIGVDLIPMFASIPAHVTSVRLEAASITDWLPGSGLTESRNTAAWSGADLITCVHGLHYVGDKLAVLARAVSWLRPDGLFAGHMDLDNIHLEGGVGGTARALRKLGLRWDPRRHLLSCRGLSILDIPFEYLGADARSGPNWTGQPAVTSHYRAITPQ